MISIKAALLLAALVIGGVCSAVAVNYFVLEEDKTAARHAIYCKHFKYSKKPFPGCEASHVGY